VTVVFADLVGFTAIAEHMDPEQVHRLINTCFDYLVPIIEQYDGTVDKFIGDEVMALFGAPVAHEDDPVRALHAARDMLAAMQRFNADHGTEFALHIGINTGLVIAGGIGSQGRQHYSVLGDAVNLASRLMSIATGNEIILGPETHRRTRHMFTFETLPPTAIKGRSELVQAYKLADVQAQPGSVRGLNGISSPLVGRAKEFALLERVAGKLASGLGGAAMLIGEAGIGKSRLMAEWRAATRAAQPNIVWMEGRCLSYGQEIAYHLLRDMLRSLIGVPATSDEAATTVALRGFVTNVMGAGAAETIEALRHLLLLQTTADDSSQGGPQAMQAQYLAALRALFLAMTSRGPVVVVLEDTHWADPSSIDLLVKLLPLKDEVPILLVATTRPDRDVPGWQLLLASGNTNDNAYQIVLTPLPVEMSRELVANLLRFESLPESVRSLILTKADGNPFFVEEVIRTLIEQNAIVYVGNEWIAPQEVATLDLPNNVHGLLAARVDRLPARQRQLLRMAAVIGRRFSVPVLAEILDQDPLDVMEQLKQLADNELLRRDLVAPTMFFRFRHALVHEVVYTATLQEERRRLHHDVGHTLERLYPERRDELAATLAYHFEQADNDHALEYLILAGDIGYRQYAIAEAVSYYKRAYERHKRPESSLTETALTGFYLNYGRVLELNGQFEPAFALYRELVDRGRATNNSPMVLPALIEQGRLHVTPNIVRDQQLGRQVAQEALLLAQELQDPVAEARIYWILALSHGYSGELDESFRYGELCIELSKTHDLREQMAYILHDSHRAFRNTNRLDEAKRRLDKAMVLWRELGNLPMLADGLNSSADLLNAMGDNDGSLRLAQEGYQLSQSISNTWNEGFSCGIIGEVYLERGEFSAALEWLSRSVKLSQRSGPIILTLRAWLDSILAHLALGDLPSARATLESAEALESLVDGFFREGFIVAIQALKVRLSVLEGDLPTADRLIAPISMLVRQDRVFASHITVLVAETTVARSHADWATMESQAATVLNSLEENPNKLYLATVLQIYGEALFQQGCFEQAEEHLQRALTLTRSLKAMDYSWRIAWMLNQIAEQTGDFAAASRWRDETLAAFRFVIEHITSPEQRRFFLDTPAVQAFVAAEPVLALA
jgi:predicted ATPase/class 3 adenylate cyclase